MDADHNANHPQIYVKNLDTGAISIASAGPHGPANSFATWETLSADNNIVVFHSPATNLTDLPILTTVTDSRTGQTENVKHVYVKNLSTGDLSLLDADLDPSHERSAHPILSADGKYVLFESTPYLGSGSSQTWGAQRVYIKNMVTGSLTLLPEFDPSRSGSFTSPSPQVFSKDDSKVVFSIATLPDGATTFIDSAVLADAGPAPTEGHDVVAGDDVVSAGEAGAATFTGISDAIGGTVMVSIDTLGHKIGTTSVQSDGKWSLTADVGSLSQGSHTEFATVQGDSWLSTTEQHQFTVSTVISGGGGGGGGGSAPAPTPTPTPTTTPAPTTPPVTTDNPPSNNTPDVTPPPTSPVQVVSEVTDQPYSKQIDDYDPTTGAFLGSTFLKPNGTVYLKSTYGVRDDGTTSYTYDSGAFFRRKPYTSFVDSYAPDDNITLHVENNRDGSHSIEIEADSLRVKAIGDDTFFNDADNVRFVFRPGFGNDTIYGFEVAGAKHDVVNLPAFARDRLDHILATAKDDGQGNTTIHVDPSETITFQGVTAKQLFNHQDIFRFQA